MNYTGMISTPKPPRKMDYTEKNNSVNISVLILFLFGVVYVCISTTSISKQVFFHNCEFPSPDKQQNKMMKAAPKDELETALEKASMGNKTVIITILNKAYVEGDSPGIKTMLDMFLDAFWVGEDSKSLLNHVLLVAIDQTAFDRCNFLRLHCYKLVTDGIDFSSEELFMSPNFIKIMFTKVLFLGDILRRGYSFILTDTDVMWLRNPFKRFSLNESLDLQFSSDAFNGDQWSQKNYVNTGFFFVRANNKTIALFESWYTKAMNSTWMNEQDVLEKMKNEGVFKQMGLKVRFMDTLYFSGFCVDYRDLNSVITIHGNCCRGLKAKLTTMTVALQDWKKYKSTTDQTKAYYYPNHTVCKQSWKS